MSLKLQSACSLRFNYFLPLGFTDFPLDLVLDLPSLVADSGALAVSLAAAGGTKCG